MAYTFIICSLCFLPPLPSLHSVPLTTFITTSIDRVFTTLPRSSFSHPNLNLHYFHYHLYNYCTLSTLSVLSLLSLSAPPPTTTLTYYHYIFISIVIHSLINVHVITLITTFTLPSSPINHCRHSSHSLKLVITALTL